MTGGRGRNDHGSCRLEAEDTAVVLTATNKNSSFSFTVTEFQPS